MAHFDCNHSLQRLLQLANHVWKMLRVYLNHLGQIAKAF